MMIIIIIKIMMIIIIIIIPTNRLTNQPTDMMNHSEVTLTIAIIL